MKVTVDTLDKTTVYTGGEYPVGHITQVVKQYVMKQELADNLLKNMKARIKELENDQGNGDLVYELKMHGTSLNQFGQMIILVFQKLTCNLDMHHVKN